MAGLNDWAQNLLASMHVLSAGHSNIGLFGQCSNARTRTECCKQLRRRSQQMVFCAFFSQISFLGPSLLTLQRSAKSLSLALNKTHTASYAYAYVGIHVCVYIAFPAINHWLLLKRLICHPHFVVQALFVPVLMICQPDQFNTLLHFVLIGIQSGTMAETVRRGTEGLDFSLDLTT